MSDEQGWEQTELTQLREENARLRAALDGAARSLAAAHDGIVVMGPDEQSVVAAFVAENDALRARAEELRGLLLMLVRDPALRANLQDLADHRAEWACVSELLPAREQAADEDVEDLPADHPRCPQCSQPLLNDGRVCITHGWLDEDDPPATAR